MFMERQRSPAHIGLVLCFLCAIGGFAGTISTVFAEDQVIDLNSPEAIRHTLEQQAVKRVKLKLISGQDLEGKVSKVGSQAVVITELSGMEFFDATVRVDQIASVIVRVRTKIGMTRLACRCGKRESFTGCSKRPLSKAAANKLA
jgi:preprotein translocase subunit YajC